MSSESSGFSYSSSGPSGATADYAAYAAQLAKDMYQWASGVYGKTSKITDEAVNSLIGQSGLSLNQANEMWGRYQQKFQPQEDALIKDANTYASTAKKQQMMGRAGAETAQSMGQQRQAALEDLRSYGVDPSSGRFAQLDAIERAQQGAAVAGSENQAELATEATGRALRSEAIQVGQRYPGQVQNSLNTAMAGQSAAENASLANANTGANLMKLPGEYLNTAMSLKPYSSSMSFQHSSSSGRDRGGAGNGPSGNEGSVSPESWSGLQPNSAASGNDAGGGATAPSSAVYKGFNNDGSSWGSESGGFNYGGLEYEGGSGSGFAAGGEVEDNGPALNMGDEQTTGGQVPTSASPSGGQEVDDVPARLMPDEFVIPRDVAKWKGEEFFQNLIQKSRQARQQPDLAGATMRAPLRAPPAFQSRALPIG